MSRVVDHRIDFVMVFDVVNGNPNGDPNQDNYPRMRDDGLGLVTDVSLKRKIRDAVFQISSASPLFFAHQANVNGQLLDALFLHNEQADKDHQIALTGTRTLSNVATMRKTLLEKYWDLRVFGGVLSTGPNFGQIRGATQLTMSTSLDPIFPQELGITRKAGTINTASIKTRSDLQEFLDTTSVDKLQTMGNKKMIPYGLYMGAGFISAYDAEKNGMTMDDLDLLWMGLENMFELNRSSSKGLMSLRHLLVFHHEGTDSDGSQRDRERKLGCAPAWKLTENHRIVDIQKRAGVDVPLAYDDYVITIQSDRVPTGVRLEERI